MARTPPDRTPALPDRRWVCIQRPYYDINFPGSPASDVSVIEIKWIGRYWRVRKYETTPHNIRLGGGLSRAQFSTHYVEEELADAVAHFHLIHDDLEANGYRFWAACPHSVGPDTWRWLPDLKVTEKMEEEVYSLVHRVRRSEIEIGNSVTLSGSIMDLGVSISKAAKAAKAAKEYREYREAMENYAPPEPNPSSADITVADVDKALRAANERLRGGGGIPRTWMQGNAYMYGGPIFPNEVPVISDVPVTLEPEVEPPPEEEPEEPPPDRPDVWDMLEV